MPVTPRVPLRYAPGQSSPAVFAIVGALALVIAAVSILELLNRVSGSRSHDE